MKKEICCVKGCNSTMTALGLCSKHYARIKANENLVRESRSRAKHGLSNRERFDAWTQKTEGCWLWKGAKNYHGYGIFSEVRGGIKGNPRQTFQAHRKAWEFVNGPIPTGQVIRHMCHNKMCVRPDHMQLGTFAENSADNIGRFDRVRGTDSKQSKINDQIVREIRASKETLIVLARRYGVSMALVQKVRQGKVWKHVT